MAVNHRINLSSMWSWASVDDQTAEGCRLKRLIDLPSTGTLKLSRRFNCPTGLEPNADVSLVFIGFPTSGTFRFNNQTLLNPRISDRDLHFVIGAVIKKHNQIEVVGEFEKPENGLACHLQITP